MAGKFIGKQIINQVKNDNDLHYESVTLYGEFFLCCRPSVVETRHSAVMSGIVLCQDVSFVRARANLR